MTVSLPRRVLAEFLGTGLLVAVVVGSGIAAQNLSHDRGLQLLANSVATAVALPVLILVFGSVSGSHFNPVISVADWVLGRSRRSGISTRDVATYIPAQVAGAVGGCLLANAMFGVQQHLSVHHRTGAQLWLGEVVATAGLLLVVIGLARSGKVSQTPWAVGAYIGAAYWFTSSTSFANPAVTVGRMFSTTFAGIAPGSAPGFIAAQTVGAGVGVGIAVALYPDAGQVADELVVPHDLDRTIEATR
jgi:arsenate reductase